jgi:hypothetical protein
VIEVVYSPMRLWRRPFLENTGMEGGTVYDALQVFTMTASNLLADTELCTEMQAFGLTPEALAAAGETLSEMRDSIPLFRKYYQMQRNLNSEARVMGRSCSCPHCSWGFVLETSRTTACLLVHPSVSMSNPLFSLSLSRSPLSLRFP